MGSVTDWAGVVNIGPVLARDLIAVGIVDLASLREVGPIEAGRRLERAGRHDCTNAVLALEGALRGMRWMSMPAEDRAEVQRLWKER